VISDAGVAALAAYAALRSAALNGYTNGKMISDKAFAEAKLKELEMLLSGAAELTGIQRRSAKPIGDWGGNR
jgi:methenyltetrahydrofolate cyclohydrolase